MGGRTLYQAAVRAMQASSKADSSVKKLPARRLSSANAVDSTSLKAGNGEGIKSAEEESRRMVLFLSCWGPY